jgi:hypothetical protein
MIEFDCKKSLGLCDDSEYIKRLSEKMIRVLIPKLFRELFPDNQECLDAAKFCEDEGSLDSADAADAAAADAARSPDVLYPVNYTDNAVDAAVSIANSVVCIQSGQLIDAANFINDAARFADQSENSDKYSQLSNYLSLEVLRELGCKV